MTLNLHMLSARLHYKMLLNGNTAKAGRIIVPYLSYILNSEWQLKEILGPYFKNKLQKQIITLIFRRKTHQHTPQKIKCGGCELFSMNESTIDSRVELGIHRSRVSRRR
jgi:hypothetical protein